MKNVNSVVVAGVSAVFGLLATSWVASQQTGESLTVQPYFPAEADPMRSATPNSVAVDLSLRLFLTCDKARKPTLDGASVDVLLDGRPIKCPETETSPLLRVAPHLATSGVASKVYFFSNIGTQPELDVQLRMIGIAERWITKNSPTLFRAIKSRPAKRFFGVLALAEGGYSLYQLIANDESTEPLPPAPSLQRHAPESGAVVPQSGMRRELDAVAPLHDCESRQSLSARMLCFAGKP